MISFCFLNETLGGMYDGVRDGNLKQIGSNAWDTTKTVGRGIATGAKAIGSGAKVVGNGMVTAGKHIVQNKDIYGYGAGIGAGAIALAHILGKHNVG